MTAPRKPATSQTEPRSAVHSDALLGLGGKVCNECGQRLPLEAFSPNKLGKQGVASKCKPCRALILRSDPRQVEKQKRRSRRHYAENKAAYLARGKARYESDPESAKAASRRRYQDDPERAAQRNAEWMARNPNKVKAIRRRASKKASKLLSDGYVRGNLIKRSDLTAEDIPDDLVALKRAHLKLKRTLKDQQP
jgi:hypothetical protein